MRETINYVTVDSFFLDKMMVDILVTVVEKLVIIIKARLLLFLYYLIFVEQNLVSYVLVEILPKWKSIIVDFLFEEKFIVVVKASSSLLFYYFVDEIYLFAS